LESFQSLHTKCNSEKELEIDTVDTQQKDINIKHAIQRINDLTAYASRASLITLKTGDVIKAAIGESPYLIRSNLFKSDEPEKEYLSKLSFLVQQFGSNVERAISVETQAIESKEALVTKGLFTNWLRTWQPLRQVTEGFISGLYDAFQFKIEEVSKKYLNQIISTIQIKEVKNEQQ